MLFQGTHFRLPGEKEKGCGVGLAPSGDRKRRRSSRSASHCVVLPRRAEGPAQYFEWLRSGLEELSSEPNWESIPLGRQVDKQVWNPQLRPDLVRLGPTPFR